MIRLATRAVATWCTMIGLAAAAENRVGDGAPPLAGPAAPLARDIRVGYLLNCTFRAIRPYCWRQAPLLTGWETDKSGGSWEGSPSGLRPDGFVFHVDSFRLRDTSGQHPVTIRHQIARQTEGKITWEFRFMLPGPMEGACWQLRDLSQPAVSIAVRDGKLVFESAGRTVPLTPLQFSHTYGVRIIADLTTQSADIYVDGQLRAQAAPFTRPVSSVDYVLIATGSAAVGDLVLPLVSVHKGYSVCETFATCGTGRAPADWNVESSSGSAFVEALACAAKPDAFSLRLTDGAQVTKRLAPCRGKTVWQFKFLLPARADGAAAEIQTGNDAPGKIVTSGGDLCYVDALGKAVPFLRDYRANLWYDVQVVADPRSGKAAISVNGKPAPSDIEFRRPGGAFAAVRFAAPRGGTMWLDDVRVCPWQDYPSDYVPQPKPLIRQGDCLVGVQSCSLWREGDAYAGWEYIYPFARQRQPYLGWYDEGSPEVADWEIKWQVEHGIDFELYCWYRPDDAIDHPIKEGVLEHGLRQGLFNARYSRLKKFAIMYTNEGAGRTNADDWGKHVVPYWIEYFFKDPRYLKIDGKPLVSIWRLSALLRDFGDVEGCGQAIAELRRQCVAAGLPGVIVALGWHNSRDQSDLKAMQTMAAMGAEYCYAYGWGTPDAALQRTRLGQQQDLAAAAGMKIFPTISVGREQSAWGQRGYAGWISVEDYRALAEWTRREFMPSLPADSLGRRVLLLGNWNEFGEGQFLMPSNLAGFGYLDALRAALAGEAASGTPEDLVPTAQQKRRFTVLYPKD